MARTFGGTLDAVVTDTRGNTLAGINVHAWDAPTGGTALGTTVSGPDGSFELTLDTTAPGLYVSAGTTGPRRYVPAREAVPDLITSLANKTNNATTAALSDRVDTTETRVGTVEDEVAGLHSTFVRRSPQTVLFLGDSITAQGAGVSATGYDYYSTRGFWVWGQIRSHQRLQLLAHLGVSGERLDQMVPRLQAALTTHAPGWVHILGGTNDIAQDRTLAQMQTSMTTMLDAARAAGARVLLGTTPPSNANTSARNAVLLSFNQWVRSLPQTRPDVTVVDYYNVLVDSAGNFDTSCAYDTPAVHPNSKGAARMGKVLGDAINAAVPYVDRIGASALDASAALAVTAPNIYPNPLVTGTGGSAINGATGSVATGWSVRHKSGGTLTNTVASKVARTDGIAGEWQQVALSAAAGVSRTQLSVNGSTGGLLNPGDRVTAFAEFSEDAAASGVTASDFGFQGVDTGGTPVMSTYGLFLFGGDTWPTEYPIANGVVSFPTLTVPAGGVVWTTLFVDRGATTSSTSTHRVGRTVARRSRP